MNNQRTEIKQSLLEKCIYFNKLKKKVYSGTTEITKEGLKRIINSYNGSKTVPLFLNRILWKTLSLHKFSMFIPGVGHFIDPMEVEKQINSTINFYKAEYRDKI